MSDTIQKNGYLWTNALHFEKAGFSICLLLLLLLTLFYVNLFMVSAMENVIVFGNGFDLAFDLPTSYADFVNSSYWPINGAAAVPDTGFLMGFIYDFTRRNLDSLGNVNWIDLESLILEYALSKKKRLNFASDDEVVKADKAFFELLKRRFTEYLVYEVYPLLTSKLKSDLLLVNKVMKAVIANGSFKKAYSFNYTDTAEIIDFVYGCSLNVTHLHGVVRDACDPIILGISDSADVPSEYSFLMKSHHSSFCSHNLNDDLYGADEIILYGLSLGSADFEYFKRFLVDIVKDYRSGTPKKHIHIFTFDDKSRSGIMKSITDIAGLRMSDVYACIDFKFYVAVGWPASKGVADNYNAFFERMTAAKPGNFIVYTAKAPNKHSW